MKSIIVIVIAAMILSCSTFGFAQSTGGIILEDGLYGTVIGALVGAAVLAFKDEPGDHLDYMARGAGIGAVAGVLFGVYEATAFASLHDGNIKFAVPTVKTRPVNSIDRSIEASVDILKFSF